jgi:hypothetical protein
MTTAFVTRQGSLPIGSTDIGILPQSAIANPSVWGRFLHLPLVKVIDAFLLRCMCVLDLLLAAAVLLFGYSLVDANVLFIRCGLSSRQRIRENSSFDFRRCSRSQFSRDI